jgi:GT2 family glycosyltransferase/ADP-heptose:LPS heptosyltransferase
MTLDCLASLKNVEYDNFEIVIVDNGSLDDSVKKIAQAYPDVHIIRNRINIGCCEGRNVGIRYSLKKEPDYIFLLDNDTTVDPYILKELILVAQTDKRIGIVAPMIYYFDRKSTVWTAGGGVIDWKKGRFYDTGRGSIDKGQFQQKEVDTLPEGFSFVRREVFEKAGLFDPDFFFYYEGGEWTTRVKRKGFEIVFAPKAKVWHKVSFSHGKESPKFYYLRVRNQLLFMSKSAPWRYLPVFYSYFAYEFAYGIVLTLYKSRSSKEGRAAIMGFVDFLRGRYGDRNLSIESLSEPLIRKIVGFMIRKLATIGHALVKNIIFLLKGIFRLRVEILVNADWNLGDEIMSLPVYKALKERYPRSCISVRSRYPELFLNNPYVDKVNPLVDISGLHTGDEKLQEVISASGRKPLTCRPRRLVRGGFTPKVDSYDKEFDIRGEDRTKNRISLLEEVLRITIEEKAPRIYVDEAESERNKYAKSTKKKVVISTGAHWQTRQWGIGNFRQVAEHIIHNHTAEVVELGRECTSIGIGCNLINQTTVREAAVILKGCTLFIGNDSGLLHLALSVGTPSIGLFGPLDPYKLVANNALFYPLWSTVKCRGCWSKKFMVYPDVCPQGDPMCMAEIKPQEVISLIDKLLANHYAM